MIVFAEKLTDQSLDGSQDLNHRADSRSGLKRFYPEQPVPVLNAHYHLTV